jgi:hypothetical protein
MHIHCILETLPKIFFSVVLTSQDLPDLPPLDADQVIKDAVKAISGEASDARLDYMKKRKVEMNIFNNVRFALKGSSDLERLAVEMECYINALMKMCSPNVAWVSHR